ncbi:hypothetical protein [Saccharopolyspora spinosa]|uniref:hypothetical protein n=1 Tax=Saccharopolyspora spinosa TaxID=60894 RepID=UPI00201131C3|nr:hypothetical protein [Saccharopolyspora spinosa]
MNRARKLSCVAAVAVAALSAAVVPGPAAIAAGLPQPVTAGALPTPQTDGVVFAVAIAGNIAVAGGKFSKARPAGVAPGDQVRSPATTCWPST